jgi:autotransporter-associated beta strand protein
LAALCCAQAFAGQYWWDPAHSGGTGSGGTGTWSGADSNWWSGGSYSAWLNSDPDHDQAVFNGSGGTVTVAGGNSVSANTLTFGTGGYTFTGTGTLVLSGTSPTIDTGGYNVTFSNTLSATAGFTVSGNGALTISGPQSYAGATTINGGTLRLQPTLTGPGAPVAGSSFWLDAAQVGTLTVGTGNTVSVWANANNLAQAAVSNGGSGPPSYAAGINGLPSLLFNGGQRLWTNPGNYFNIGTSITVLGKPIRKCK